MNKKIKFNGGVDAIVCTSCYKILVEGKDIFENDRIEKNRWWCVDHFPKNIEGLPCFKDGKIIALKESF